MSHFNNKSFLEKCVTVSKRCHIQKMCDGYINVLHLKMCNKKICSNYKSAPQLEKFLSGRKMFHSKKNVSYLGKCVTFRKICHGLKNVLH